MEQYRPLLEGEVKGMTRSMERGAVGVEVIEVGGQMKHRERNPSRAQADTLNKAKAGQESITFKRTIPFDTALRAGPAGVVVLWVFFFFWWWIMLESL